MEPAVSGWGKKDPKKGKKNQKKFKANPPQLPDLVLGKIRHGAKPDRAREGRETLPARVLSYHHGQPYHNTAGRDVK
jgi:hypothetical protein